MLGSVLHILLLLFTVPLWPCLRMAVCLRDLPILSFVGPSSRVFRLRTAGHTAYAAVSARNLLKLERGHIDRKFLELTLVGEELSDLF